MQQAEHRSFNKSDQVRQFPNGRAEILQVDWFGVSNHTKHH